MRKIKKIINITLIFVMGGVLCTEIVYAIRVPVGIAGKRMNAFAQLIKYNQIASLASSRNLADNPFDDNLGDKYGIELIINGEGKEKIGVFKDCLDYLFSLIPKEMWKERVKKFNFGGSPHGKAREDGGACDYENGKVSIYDKAITDKSLFYFARTVLHEFGHIFGESLNKDEMRIVDDFLDTVKKKKRFNNYMLLPSDKYNLGDTKHRDIIKEYINSKHQFSAEFFRQFILNGNEVRFLINSIVDADIRKAYKKVYSLYREKIGKTYNNRDRKVLFDIFEKMKCGNVLNIKQYRATMISL
jgi:hypothetical protein